MIDNVDKDARRLIDRFKTALPVAYRYLSQQTAQRHLNNCGGFWFVFQFIFKTCLRHPDCESARINKGAVFHRMRLALEQVIVIVTDSRRSGEDDPGPVSICTGIKEFKVRS